LKEFEEWEEGDGIKENDGGGEFSCDNYEELF
jgi:hypothetical protein